MMSDLSQTLRQALKQYFQFDDFLDGQHHAVETLAKGDDLCVIMPTGAGKSICYQLPALLKEGYTIVVSPLIALMKDQVDALQAKGIPALYLNSTLSQGQQNANIQEVMSGRCKLLYIAPERFRASSFRNLLSQFPPECLVVDEAHCISQWGHDFRPDYKRIGEYSQQLGIKQICAFTATATPEVREDILRQLHRPEMECHVTGFTRPNLKFKVTDASGKDKKLKILKTLVAEKKPTIIYAASRKNVDEVAEQLGVVAYHAGMSDKERDEAQHYFLHDECPVLVATNAFGMGIDRGDIRRVVHYNFPGSLEAYYQEAGRAGRDGEEAECVLFFSYADRHIHEFLIDLNNPSRSIIEDTWEAVLNLDDLYEHQPLEVKLADLATQVPGSKEQQLSGVLKILEDGGYIERSFRNNNKGHLRLLGDLNELRTEHSQIRTQRSIFIVRIIDAYQQALVHGIEVSYYDLERCTGFNGEQVKRILRAIRDN